MFNSTEVFMNEHPASYKVTVVTVCYNAVRDIEKTILSVINQTYDNVEYLVIDGGSTDGTVDIIRKYSDSISYWVSEPDKGIYYAMNKAIEVASGDYINFMNAGDVFFDNNVIAEVFNNKHYTEDVIYGATVYRFKGGYKITTPDDKILKHMAFCHQSSFSSVRLMKAHPFDTTFRTAADCMFFRWVYKNGGSLKEVKKYISIFDANGFSTNCSLSNFCEIAAVSSIKISLKRYLSWVIEMKFRKIRYGKLRFKIAEKRKPYKYRCKLEDIKQLN